MFISSFSFVFEIGIYTPPRHTVRAIYVHIPFLSPPPNAHWVLRPGLGLIGELVSFAGRDFFFFWDWGWGCREMGVGLVVELDRCDDWFDLEGRKDGEGRFLDETATLFKSRCGNRDLVTIVMAFTLGTATLALFLRGFALVISPRIELSTFHMNPSSATVCEDFNHQFHHVVIMK